MDMIDFSRTAFNKEFKTSVSSVEKFDSKFPLVKLGSLINGTPQYGANQKAVEGNPLMDYRYIRITDINEDGTLNDDWKTVAEVEKQYILKEGDVLFARSGATAGKAFYYKNEYGKALYAGYLIRFRFDESKVIPLFVYNLLCSKEYNDWVEKTKVELQDKISTLNSIVHLRFHFLQWIFKRKSWRNVRRLITEWLSSCSKFNIMKNESYICLKMHNQKLIGL